MQLARWKHSKGQAVGRRRSGSNNRIRDKIIPMRADDAEKAAIQDAAERAGLDVSELMRRAVFREIGYSTA